MCIHTLGAPVDAAKEEKETMAKKKELAIEEKVGEIERKQWQPNKSNNTKRKKNIPEREE